MASTEAHEAALSVDEVAAMSDVDLGLFMKQYCRLDGGYELRCAPTPILDYHELIDMGGRPSYPIDIVQDVHRNSDNYAEILCPWQRHPINMLADDIFDRQLKRWNDFRKWQNDKRGREDDDAGFPAYNGFYDYMEAVTRRLARHDFTRLFGLDEDLKKQDQLTT
ncbi:hypothetical protein F4779DRAFT_617561 [Xylariaceae sp. FL0662B]|nr:hypothetical protein F4779DRAFT_617561 [Xylariaceae sp. FL0662B]